METYAISSSSCSHQSCDKTSSADEKTTSVVYVVFSSQLPVFRLSICLSSAAAQRVLCIPATAAANERVSSSFKHIWSDKRSSLLLGCMWLLAFIYFNKRVLERKSKPQPEAEWQQFAQWMQHMPAEA
ncbi:hypothetical protein QJQ45_005563 [Haematococcus lacustris]|nr:hypothetical protein QJQ45_005563 [Haematococcus lacustris]